MSNRLTARDVENQEFSRRMRGIDPDEVKLFLRSVAEEIERIQLENGELLEEIGRLKLRQNEFQEREQTLQQTLVTAQNMSGQIKDRAKEEADLVVRQARLNSERMLQQAQDQLARLESEISRCKLERDLFERRLRTAIEEHLSLLDQRREVDGDLENLHVMPRRAGADAG